MFDMPHLSANSRNGLRSRTWGTSRSLPATSMYTMRTQACSYRQVGAGRAPNVPG